VVSVVKDCWEVEPSCLNSNLQYVKQQRGGFLGLPVGRSK